MKNQASQNGENLEETTSYIRVLNKAFAPLPKRTVILYPNMGDDTTPAEVTRPTGQDVIATSDQDPQPRPNNLYILSSLFNDYNTLTANIHPPMSVALFSNGLDSTLPSETFHDFLEKFEGVYLFHFDSHPQYDGRGREMIGQHPYMNVTNCFLNQQDISQMRQQPLNIYERLKR